MKLVTFSHGGATRIGVVVDDNVVDLSAAAPELPREMAAFLGEGNAAMERARKAAGQSGNRIALKQVKLEAPIMRPPEFLAVGLNYADHIAETGRDKPDFPVFFNKQTSCVNGPYDPIHSPRDSLALDYEGEMAFVIGKRCRHVPRDKAREVIAGYTIVNDVSTRDWQRRAQTMTLGKSFDTHGPIGPWIVTADEVPDPHSLKLRCFVNGEVRQESDTSQMIFNIWQQIAYLSTAFTLESGDLIATGTPEGVGVGMQPPRFLQPGDVVRCEIERIGVIENRVRRP